MLQFFSYLINGISLGSVYAIIALGYSMVYGIAKMLNFAHGDVIMIGAYIAFCATQYWGMSPLLGVLIAMIVCTVLGMVIERLAYKPLRQATSLAVLITAIGVSYLLQNLALLVFGPNPMSFPSFVSIPSISLFDGQLILTGETIVTVLANIIIMLVLTAAAFLVYLYFCMNLNSYITLLIQRGEELSHVFRKAMPPFYHFAIALEQGSLSSFLQAVLWGVLPAGVFLWLVQKGFLDLRSTSGVKAVYRKKPLRVSRPWMAVCRKEGVRLLSMPTYLFNCGIGALLMVAMAAMVAWKGTDALQAMGAVPQIRELIAPALMAAMCFCAATTCTTSPSRTASSGCLMNLSQIWEICTKPS